MSEPPSLLNLPNELLAMITEDTNLTNTDLANLRLTCKRTKHFASNHLGQQLFVDLDVWYTRDAFHCFSSLLLSDLGRHVRRVSLFRSDEHKKLHPIKPFVQKKGEDEPDYYQLQNLEFMHCNGSVRSWKKVIHGATHLKSFKHEDLETFWPVVYRHKFDHNDELLSSIRSDCLTELGLAQLHISASVLNQLLINHSGTLSKLSIKACMLVDGKWLEVVDWIRSNLSQLRILCINARHEVFMKKVPRYPQHEHFSSYDEAYRERSPYTVVTHAIALQFSREGQQEISNGLSELLEARGWVQGT